MLPRRTVVLVNADFESRAHELSSGDAPRGYEADRAVLDTAQAVAEALRSLGVEAEELRVKSSLQGVARELGRRGVRTVFNLVESIDNDYTREWQVPARLARHGIAYTGNGARTLRLCAAKDRARRVLARAGVRIARGFVVGEASELSPARLARARYPVFVKPARVDGSIGIDRDSICGSPAQLSARLEKLSSHLAGPFLVEEFLPGKEINVSIFPALEAGFVVPTEIDFSPVPSEFPRIVTYDGKWNPDSPEFHSKSVPADLSPELRVEVEELARRAFGALFGTSYGRVDMRLDASGRPCVIDVNPNNDIHPDAGLARAAGSIGWDYARLIGAVLERTCEVQRGATTRRSA